MYFFYLLVDFLGGKVYNKIAMEKYQHIQPFHVRFCDVDFQNVLKLSTTLAFFEEAACYSADELGYGYEYVKAKGLAFVLTNLCCEFLRPVRLFDKDVKVRTWPLPPTFATFGREYLLCVGEEIAARASSRWCLYDLKNGKIEPAKSITEQDYSTYNTDRVFERTNWKVPAFSLEEGELSYVMRVGNSDCDHNIHVNNTKYADYCFNVFTMEELAKRRLRYFSIAYAKQCKEGETLRFYKKYAGEGKYYVQGVNENEEIVVRAEMDFI